MSIQNRFSVSNKKAFTLIEVLISVSILVLIFMFVYSQFNLAQKSTKKTTLIEKQASKRTKIIELLYNDFLSSKDITPTSGRKYDKFMHPFITKNSLYDINSPYVKYAVVSQKEGNNLIRIEGTSKDISISNANSEFYIDIILKNITHFKVLQNTEYIEFFIKAKDMKDIYFKFKRFYK